MNYNIPKAGTSQIMDTIEKYELETAEPCVNTHGKGAIENFWQSLNQDHESAHRKGTIPFNNVRIKSLLQEVDQQDEPYDEDGKKSVEKKGSPVVYKHVN